MGDSINAGDFNVQFAIERFLVELGLPSSAQRATGIFRLDKEYPDKSRRISIIQGLGMISPELTFFPPPAQPNVYPLYFGLCILEGGWEYLRNNLEFIERLKASEPIGCRDAATVDYLRSLGIKAFFSGCFTMTLPHRKTKPLFPHVFVVEGPDNLRNYMPRSLQSCTTEFSNILRCEQPISLEQFNRFVYDRLMLFKKHATLIVTKRIHAALPCAAMGIPVIFLHHSQNDPRTSLVRSILPYYHVDNLSEIDWSPDVPKAVEVAKKRFKLMFKCRLQDVERQAGIKAKRLSDDEYLMGQQMIDEACHAPIAPEIYNPTSYSKEDLMGSLFGSQLKLVQTGKKQVVLYGLGWAGKRLGLLMKYWGLNNLCFCDSKIKDDELGNWNDIPVISLKRMKEQKEEILIVIASRTYFEEINDLLIDNGFASSCIIKSLSAIDKYSNFVIPTIPSSLYYKL